MKETNQAEVRHHLKRCAQFASLLLLVMFAPLWQAAHAQLYGPVAPPGSAFMRVFNATTGPDVKGQIGDKPLGSVGPFEATKYVFLPPGSYPLSAGSEKQTVQLDGDHCYTGVLTAAGLKVFPEDLFKSEVKGSLSVFNLLPDKSVSLRTSSGVSAFEGVAAGTSTRRDINAVTLNLQLFEGDTKKADAPQVIIDRGHSASLFIAGTLDAPIMKWVVN